jgi:hypothetical protein
VSTTSNTIKLPDHLTSAYRTYSPWLLSGSVVSPSSHSRPCPHHASHHIASHNVQPIISPRIYLSSPSSPLINPKLTMTPLALSSLALRASECSVAVFWRKWDLICLARAICGGAKRGQRWNVSLVLGWCLGLGRRHGI